MVRLLSWQWQFHLNVPLGLVALTLALLGPAKVQSVSGLEDLRGGGSTWWTGPWLYAVALVALVGFIAVERRLRRLGVMEPIIGPLEGLSGAPGVAMAVNALVGVGLVTALTAAMAAASYAGGRWAGHAGNNAPARTGICLALVGFLVMGFTWSPSAPSALMAIELAVVGVGVGLVLAPTSAAVDDAAAAESGRGSAAGLVIVSRLVGFNVGLAALTAWGLHRYDHLRSGLELPTLGSAGYQDALTTAAIDITTTALTETFLGAALALGLALALLAMVRIDSGSGVSRPIGQK
ncbi:MAG: hypothetical protein P8N02_02105 [Actinomycetota bacterium]|nr:hypothetical protein [Actinomycetota bacterium]